jgi:nitrate reductase NapE component
MTLVGKAAEECDLLERQIVPSQMTARLFDFLFLNKGVRAYPVVSVEFAGELNRRAVADGR